MTISPVSLGTLDNWSRGVAREDTVGSHRANVSEGVGITGLDEKK